MEYFLLVSGVLKLCSTHILFMTNCVEPLSGVLGSVLSLNGVVWTSSILVWEIESSSWKFGPFNINMRSQCA